MTTKVDEITRRNGLTPKQTQVLDMLEEGKTPPEIAKKMKISNSGVYGHMRGIRKTGVTLPAERVNGGAPSGGDGPAVPELELHAPGEVAEGEVQVVDTIEHYLSEARSALREADAEREVLEAKLVEVRAVQEHRARAIERHQAALAAYK